MTRARDAAKSNAGAAKDDEGEKKAEGHKVSSIFNRFARATSRAAGRPIAFTLAVLLIVGWAALGPVMGFSEGWQLFVNTTTTIVTFLMVFLMQSTQNRDTEALQLKIDELIRAVAEADDAVIALDEAEEEELAAARKKYLALANGKQADDAAGADDTPRRRKGDRGADELEDAATEAVASGAPTPRSSRRPGGRAPRR